MICECKSKAFYLHLIYKHNIPLKLTIAKAIALRETTLPWGLYHIYVVLYAYIVIGLYIYIGIALFIYYFIACQKHGGITFFISIFYFCSLLRPLFFYDSGCRLSIIWLFTVQRYGGSVRYQTPGDALFGENFFGTPSTNVAHLGFPKNFLPNCLVF